MKMSSSKLLFFFYLTFIQLLVLNMAQQYPDPLSYSCGKTGNFSTTGNYKSNLDRVLASLSANTKINSGFYNYSFGQNTNKVNAIALCRGDTKPDTCRSCINNSSHVLTQLCPNQKEAITWYDDCMVRYSNRSIFGNMEFHPAGYMYNLKNVSDANEFSHVVITLLDNLTNSAASGDSLRKFATGTATAIKNNQTIYALAQCTPDLSKQDCGNCLNNITAFIPKYVDGKQGARIFAPSCHFRYEIELFYDSGMVSSSPSPSPSLSPSPSQSASPQPPPPAAPVPQSTPLPSSPQAATPPQTPNGAANVTGKRRNIAVVFIFSVLILLL